MKPSDKKIDKIPKGFQGFKFLGFVLILYITLFFINKEKTIHSLQYFGKNTLMVIPIFAFVILLTAVINYYFPKERIGKMLQNQSKTKTFGFSLLAGIISHGPVFAWFPLLKNLNDKGLHKGALVTFFYARSIKLTLLPVMIGFFGKIYSLIFIVFIAVSALLQGIIFLAFSKKNT
jgi:uncharacterized membrane protein YraQ (UPF0718 family)